jgi:hypothetical protein
MIPKFIGRDCELSTTGIGAEGESQDSSAVTRKVLAYIESVFAARNGTVWFEGGRFYSASMDCLRHWTSSGQCYYADMAHVEICTATCLDPLDFTAQCWHVVQAAEAARAAAQQAADDGESLSLSTSNADLLDPSISFGTHLSVAIEKSLWEDLFLLRRSPARLAMVAAGVAAAIPFFGAGYLLPFKDRTCYSLSARAHHLSWIATLSTTEPFHRGILNSRREPHGDGMDRLHLIGFDFCLPSSPLLCSFLQCLLAAAEEGYCGLQLYDPVRALRLWSWGLDMETGRMPQTAQLVDGRQLTLPQYLRELTETLLKMCRANLIPESVAPGAAELLPRIVELTHHAEGGDVLFCAKHLTWAAKLLCLLDLCAQDGVQFGDAVTRLADHDFTNTDPARGTIWPLLEEQRIEPLVGRSAIDACWHDAPRGTRDFVRGRLIRRFHQEITAVDWGTVTLRRAPERWSRQVKIDLPLLDARATAHIARLIERAETVDQLLAGLEPSARDSDPVDDVTDRLALPDNFNLS